MDDRYESTTSCCSASPGSVDDDLLAWARELVAVGEDGTRCELVTAALVADAIPLPPPVRAALVDAAAAARDRPGRRRRSRPRRARTHRAPVRRPGGRRRARRRRGAGAARPAARGHRLQLAWRLTPAGPAPGPLPHPVVLVEIGRGRAAGRGARLPGGGGDGAAGVHVAVEVLTSGRPLTSYHAAAMRDSTPLSGDAPLRPAAPPEKVESAVAEVVQQVTESHRNAPPEDAHDERPVDLFAVDEPPPRPVPMRGWQSGRRRRGFGEQVAEAEVDDDLPEADDHEPLPSPVPLARRTRPRPVGEVVEQPDPLRDPIPNEGTWTDEWASGDWAVAEDRHRPARAA